MPFGCSTRGCSAVGSAPTPARARSRLFGCRASPSPGRLFSFNGSRSKPPLRQGRLVISGDRLCFDDFGYFFCHNDFRNGLGIFNADLQCYFSIVLTLSFGTNLHEASQIKVKAPQDRTWRLLLEEICLIPAACRVLNVIDKTHSFCFIADCSTNKFTCAAFFF